MNDNAAFLPSFLAEADALARVIALAFDLTRDLQTPAEPDVARLIRLWLGLRLAELVLSAPVMASRREMSGRLPVCEDAAAITARIAELRAERTRIIAGCHCPQSPQGEVTHNALCPLRPEPPSQMQLTLEAMQRPRARLRQAGVPIREVL